MGFSDKAPLNKTSPGKSFNIKDIKSVIDSEPVLSEEMLKFSEWLSSYYVAPPGETVFLFLPKRLNIKSEYYYSLAADYEEKLNSLIDGSDDVFDVVSLIKKSSAMTPNFLVKTLEKKSGGNIKSVLNFLEKQKIILKSTGYSKQTGDILIKTVHPLFRKEEIDDVILSKGIKAKRQIEFLKILAETEHFPGAGELSEIIKKGKFAYSTAEALELKGLIKITDERKSSSHGNFYQEDKKDFELNAEQEYCIKEISASLNANEFKSYLLYGITGSGKTEVYIRALAVAMEQGKTAIVLVPEISLTPQLIRRFKNVFGDKVGVMHSKLNDSEKLHAYHSIKEGRHKILIGPRSALFAPLENLGIIIVDEEHDTSYKQENSPKYNARDAAIVRAKFNNAVVVLGSATPSVESYNNALNGKYSLLEIKMRVESGALPEIRIINLREKPDKTNSALDFLERIKVKFLSHELIYAIGERIEKKESVILLQNRRGYHSFIECLSCGNVDMCIHCNISLTYHKNAGILQCHFCGYSKPLKGICSACGSDRLIPKGTGTERVEDELKKIFPKAVVERLDSDTMGTKYHYQKVLNDFRNGSIDILVGTQVISKGLDFPNVTLVGVVNSDIGLLLPDFRSNERTFQLLTQVSGRSGRSGKKGEVYIQTNHAEYDLFNKVKEHDYSGFYETEIMFRKECNYPPYSRIGLIEVRSKDLKLTENTIKKIFERVAEFNTEKSLLILPPAQPLFSKIKDYHRYHLLIKSPKNSDPSGSRLTSLFRTLSKEFPEKGDLRIIYDVDAYSLL